MGKMKVGLLVKEELEYELKIRGLLVEGDTVDTMKSKLRGALSAESGTDTSFVCPVYPYTHAEDIDALGKKLDEVKALVEEYKREGKLSVYRRCREKAEFALRRASYMPAVKQEEKQEVMAIRSQLILQLGALFSTEDDSDSDSVDEEVSGPVATSTPNLGGSRKESVAIVDVTKWNLKFKGEHNGSINAFLERAEEMRLAKRLSKGQLFKAAVELFSDKALIWFRANRERIGGWDKLVEELRSEFLPADYDDRLWDEIRHRTQGEDETMGVYVAIMEQMFNRLSTKCDEVSKLKILRRNIGPFYQQQLAHSIIESTSDLVRLGKIVETTRASIEAFTPPTKIKQSLEPDLAYGGKTYAKRSEQVQVSAIKCWKCRQEGHISKECRAPLSCYGCGRPGVKRYDCPLCSGSSGRSNRSQWRNNTRPDVGEQDRGDMNNQQNGCEWRREMRGNSRAENNTEEDRRGRENPMNVTDGRPGNEASAC